MTADQERAAIVRRDDLPSYLASHGGKPVDRTWLDSLVEDMTENVIPAIISHHKDQGHG